MSTKSIRAGLFARKSTADRPGSPNIQHQLSETRKFAESQPDWEIVAEYIEEDISGALAFMERPAIRAMFADAAAGKLDAVVFHRVDRMQRDEYEGMRIVLEAHDQDLQLWIAEQGRPYDPLGGWEGMSDVARAKGAADERKRIKQNMVRGRIQGMREGKWPGGPPPRGYRLDEDKRLVVHEPEAKVVREMFATALQPGLGSVDATVAEMNKRPQPFRLTRAWVHSALNDPIYAGRGKPITMGGRNAKGEDLGVPEETVTLPAPAIVDEGTFDAVQKILHERRLVWNRTGTKKYRYALGGKIVHVHPDGSVWSMSGERPGGRREGEILYRCLASKDKNVGCPGTTPNAPRYRRRTSVDADAAESALIREGLKLIEHPDHIAELVEEHARSLIAKEAIGPVEDNLRAALDGLDGERRRALEQHRKGWMTDTELQETMEEIAAQREGIQAQLEALHTKLDPAALVEPLAKIELLAGELETVEPGTITPEDPRWTQVLAALKDEVEGLAPLDPEEPRRLSEWARRWAGDIADRLHLVVVVQPDGSITATSSDPREKHRDVPRSSTVRG